MFEKIFNIVNKIFEIEHESIYFHNNFPNALNSIILTNNISYEMNKCKTYLDCINICSVPWNIYIIKGTSTFNDTCICNGEKTFVISISDDFMQKDILSVIKMTEDIYNHIFTELKKSFDIFDVTLAKKIFTLYTIKKWFSNLAFKHFDLLPILNEDSALHLLNTYTISDLYDLNMVYLAKKKGEI